MTDAATQGTQELKSRRTVLEAAYNPPSMLRQHDGLFAALCTIPPSMQNTGSASGADPGSCLSGHMMSVHVTYGTVVTMSGR